MESNGKDTKNAHEYILIKYLFSKQNQIHIEVQYVYFL